MKAQFFKSDQMELSEVWMASQGHQFAVLGLREEQSHANI